MLKKSEQARQVTPPPCQQALNYEGDIPWGVGGRGGGVQITDLCILRKTWSQIATHIRTAMQLQVHIKVNTRVNCALLLVFKTWKNGLEVW